MKTLRAFVAVELPMAVVPACAAARRRLAGLDARLRWVRPEGLHLTLKFLGDVEYATVPLILEAIAVGGRPDAADGVAHHGRGRAPTRIGRE